MSVQANSSFAAKIRGLPAANPSSLERQGIWGIIPSRWYYSAIWGSGCRKLAHKAGFFKFPAQLPASREIAAGALWRMVHRCRFA